MTSVSALPRMQRDESAQYERIMPMEEMLLEAICRLTENVEVLCDRVDDLCLRHDRSYRLDYVGRHGVLPEDA